MCSTKQKQKQTKPPRNTGKARNKSNGVWLTAVCQNDDQKLTLLAVLKIELDYKHKITLRHS